ncbi:MAG: SUMF1/EgtB/PvdO family nonheme iron enzyme [Proteobacteria bacterium]|nr:SUMF1/EgtB/PvdO family nonheme iron enzyme [Pseudomonadota bacterium]
MSKTARVCSKPKGNSPYGVCDMIGNVEEWVNDRFDGTYYRYSPKVSPTGPEEGSERVLRGGSWRYDGINYLRASTRQHEPPDTARDNIGFRCALTLK